jgi:hypothetical protein
MAVTAMEQMLATIQEMRQTANPYLTVSSSGNGTTSRTPFRYMNSIGRVKM